MSEDDETHLYGLCLGSLVTKGLIVGIFFLPQWRSHIGQNMKLEVFGNKIFLAVLLANRVN